MNRRKAVSLLIGGAGVAIMARAASGRESKQEWVTVADSLLNSNGRAYPQEVLRTFEGIVNSKPVPLRATFEGDWHDSHAEVVGYVYAARMRGVSLQVKASAPASAKGKHIVTCCVGTSEGGVVKLSEDPRLYFALWDDSAFALAEPLA